MKVLNIIPRYAPAIGGSETWCRDLCRFLAKQGIITKVATINMYNVAEAFDPKFLGEDFIKLGDEDFDEGVFVKRYTLWKPWSNLLSAKIIRFLLHILKLNKTQIGDIFATSPNSLQMYVNLPKQIKDVDVVILHTLPYFNNVIGFVLAKFYRKKIIMVPYFHPEHLQFERKIFYWMMKKSDAVVTLSEFEKAHLVKKNLNPKKIYVLGCAIDKEDTVDDLAFEDYKAGVFNKHGITAKSKKIIFIGRKEIYKGVFTLIEAVRRLTQEENKEIFLFLVGPDTPDFNKGYATLGDLGSLKVINFGSVSEEEKNYLLKICDVLVLPSEFESFGIVFLEAWKYNKPVVGINRGLVSSVVQNGGLCAEYGNIDDLKEKIRIILNDYTLTCHLGNRGRQKVEQDYDAKIIYGKFLNILEKIGIKRKRILIVSQLFPPHYIGGAEIVAYEQSKMLKKIGWQVKVFAGRINDSVKRFKAGKEKGRLEIIRINLYRTDFYHEQYVNYDKDELRRSFREELFMFAPDVVHFHNIYAFSLGMIDDCRNMHISTVMTLHDYWGICPKNLLLRKDGNVCLNNNGNCTGCHEQLFLENGKTISSYERNLKNIEYFNKVDMFISPSRYLAERFIARGLAHKKFKTIKYGIDLSRFRKVERIKSKKIRFVFIGQIIWHKGLDIFLQAISLLNKKERAKITVFVFGSGEMPYVSYCKKLAENYKFIKFAGKIKANRIHNLYKAIDMLVLPSRWPENSPLVIQEALACGVPVLASNLGGIPELVEDGVNGFLFKHNSPLSLAEKMKKVINQPDVIKDMHKEYVHKAQENDLREQVKIISDNYEKLVCTQSAYN